MRGSVGRVVLLLRALLVLSRFRRRYVSKKGHQIGQLEVSLAARVLVQSVDIVLPRWLP